MFVCHYVAPPGECYYNTILCCDYFSSSSVVLHAFSALCAYSMFQHHPRITVLPNLVSFAASIAGLERGEKSCTEVLNQSLNNPAYLMSRKLKLVLRNNSQLEELRFHE